MAAKMNTDLSAAVRTDLVNFVKKSIGEDPMGDEMSKRIFNFIVSETMDWAKENHKGPTTLEFKNVLLEGYKAGLATLQRHEQGQLLGDGGGITSGEALNKESTRYAGKGPIRLPKIRQVEGE